MAKWTDQEIQILDELWGQNVLSKVIGAKLGRSSGCVRMKAKSRGLHRRTRTSRPFKVRVYLTEPEYRYVLKVSSGQGKQAKVWARGRLLEGFGAVAAE